MVNFCLQVSQNRLYYKWEGLTSKKIGRTRKKWQSQTAKIIIKTTNRNQNNLINEAVTRLLNERQWEKAHKRERVIRWRSHSFTLRACLAARSHAKPTPDSDAVGSSQQNFLMEKQKLRICPPPCPHKSLGKKRCIFLRNTFSFTGKKRQPPRTKQPTCQFWLRQPRRTKRTQTK